MAMTALRGALCVLAAAASRGPESTRRVLTPLSAPLSGDLLVDGVLEVRVDLGRPSQLLSAIVDTGSSGLSVRCDAPTAEGRRSYNSAASSRSVPCGDAACESCDAGVCSFSKRYSEGSSISGRVVVDDVSIRLDGGTASPPVAAHVNCVQHEEGAFRAQRADGVLGLSQGRHGVLAALLTSGRIQRNAFTLCARGGGGGGGGGGGYLTLGSGRGGRGASSTPSSSTPLYLGRANGYYVVHAEGYAVSTADLSVASEGGGGADAVWSSCTAPLIIDSGSTYTYLPRDVVLDVVSQARAACGGASGGGRGGAGPTTGCALTLLPEEETPEGQVLCGRPPAGGGGGSGWGWDAAAATTLPALALKLQGGAVWHIPALHAYTSGPWMAGLYCLGVYPSDEVGGGEVGQRGILGLNALHGRALTVDVEGGAVMWELSACTKEAVEQTGEEADAGTAGDEAMSELVSSRLSLAAFGFVIALLLLLAGLSTRQACALYKAQRGTAYSQVSSSERGGAVRGGGGGFTVDSAADGDDEGAEEEEEDKDSIDIALDEEMGVAGRATRRGGRTAARRSGRQGEDDEDDVSLCLTDGSVGSGGRRAGGGVSAGDGASSDEDGDLGLGRGRQPHRAPPSFSAGAAQGAVATRGKRSA